MKKIFFLAAVALMSTAMFADELPVADFENNLYPGYGIQTSEESPYWYGEPSAVAGLSYWYCNDYTYQFFTYKEIGVYATFYYDFVVTRDNSNEYTDYAHAYRSASGGAYEGDNFAVWCMNFSSVDTLEFMTRVVPGFFVNNTAYAVTSMCNGDDFAKKFTEDDWFKLTIHGVKEGAEVGTVDVDLAKEGKYINEWTYVDLSTLGEIDGVFFTMSSSDESTYEGETYMNTPAYFAMDNFGAIMPEGYVAPEMAKLPVDLRVATFEDVEIAEPESVLHLAETGTIKSGCFLFAQEVNVSEWGTYFYGNLPTNKSDNTFESYLDAEKSACGGAYEGNNFVVWTASYEGDNGVSLDHASVVPGFFINNTAYDANSMCNGDGYAKKFTKDDWFKLTITASLAGDDVNTQVEVDLAKDGKYIDKWTYVDLSILGEIDALRFALSSSDNGAYGMNTPAYFAMDNFGAIMPEGYVAPEMAEIPVTEGIANTKAAVKATKVVRNGQVVIIRDNKAFNILGAEL